MQKTYFLKTTLLKAIADKYKRKLMKCFDCMSDIRGGFHKEIRRSQYEINFEEKIFCKKCYKVKNLLLFKTI